MDDESAFQAAKQVWLSPNERRKTGLEPNTYTVLALPYGLSHQH